ncbi:hypothetical protein GQ53DRAFT_379558 [Thozetella sp. PMI_491]|nr:hypothetical protein GQ53DRAFT_379558 [Thozetella sp. PMI_491]
MTVSRHFPSSLLLLARPDLAYSTGLLSAGRVQRPCFSSCLGVFWPPLSTVHLSSTAEIERQNARCRGGGGPQYTLQSPRPTGQEWGEDEHRV